MILLLPAPLKFAARGQRRPAQRIVEGGVMPRGVLLGHPFQPHAADAADGFGKVFIDERAAQAHGLEQLRTAVALHGGDAHLGHGLYHALYRRVQIPRLRLLL